MKNRFLKTFIFSILLITTLSLGMASAWEIPGGWDNFNRALRVIPDGTSTAPAWAFKSEPTLGFYRSGSGVISLVGGNLNLGANELLLDSLKLNDSDDSHYLEILTNSNLTGNRILTITPGDAARTITLSGNPTLSDWFDQGVKTTGTPTFNSLILSANWYQAAGTYHNFGATLGATGYGIYDNGGTLQFKNSGGAWADLVSAVSAGGWQDDGTIVRLITGTDNVGMGGATAGGTNLAGGLVWGNGTAPTTYPANASQFWMADEGSRGGYSHPHFANEAGQNGAMAFQAPLVNLLSNSGFGVWSNGTLENVGSQLVASWTNADYDTFTSAGADITSAVYTTVGTQDASSAAITLVSGKSYKIVVTLTLNSGQAPTLAMTNLDHTSAAISAGANTFVREATDTTTTLTVSNTAAANWSATFTLYEVTPGTVAVDSLGPDGYAKESSIDAWRQHNDGGTYTKDGSFYALKVYTTSINASMQWPLSATSILPEFYQKFAGKLVTLGEWVKSDQGVKIAIYDGATLTQSAAHTGGNAWEWLEISATISATPTDVRFQIYRDVVGSATTYISQPMLVFGPSIGAGNYAPSPNETIYTEKVISLTDYTATTSAADATINLEAQSSGMIPKGVKAVLVKAYGKDSAAGDGVGFDVQSTSGVEDGLSIDTQVNNVRVQGQGWVKADANGDIVFDHRGSGASALTIDLKVIGVQP